jgi:rubredoxin
VRSPRSLPQPANRVWRCRICGFVYREEEGLPEEGIEPGTPWEAIPEDWACPDCGTSKAGFHMVELDEAELDY